MIRRIAQLWMPVWIWTTCLAQQPPQYTQYYFNNYLVNPAVGGNRNYPDIKLGYRTQWVGFKSAPQTFFASFHTPLTKKKQSFGYSKRTREAIGGYALRDQSGPISRTSGYLSYSYHIPVSRKITTSLGIFGGAMQYTINGSSLTPVNRDDPAVLNLTSIVPDAAAGVWTYSDNLFTGLSAHQLLPVRITGSDNRLVPHLFFTAGYAVRAGRGSIIPSIHVKTALLSPVTLDVNLKYDWMNKFWFGVSYRKIDALAGMVGFSIGDFLEIGYAYDYTLSKIQAFSSNTHEIIVGILPKRRGVTYLCPAYM